VHAAGVRAGDPAPGFTLPDWEGRRVALADFRGKPVCIDFWASWCTSCKAALPALDALARRHGAVAFLAVNVDRDRDAAERFLTEHLPTHALVLLRDPTSTVLSRYGAAGMPALYLVDSDGVVRLAEGGYGPEGLDRLERTLGALAPPP
jgi:thiol-disulfide isomerase/thioredoxin